MNQHKATITESISSKPVPAIDREKLGFLSREEIEEAGKAVTFITQSIADVLLKFGKDMQGVARAIESHGTVSRELSQFFARLKRQERLRFQSVARQRRGYGARRSWIEAKTR